MVHQCYICEQIFDSKEKLFEHLEVHTKTRLSPLDEDEIIDQFNECKLGEPSRMSSKPTLKHQEDDSLLILKRRLALGEITKEEFEELSAKLGYEETVESEEKDEEEETQNQEHHARIIYDD